MESTRGTYDPPRIPVRDEVGGNRDILQSRSLTIGGLQVEAGGTVVSRGEWNGAVPLSYAQERLWFLDRLGLVGAAYNMPMALRLRGDLNCEALQLSFSELVRRHESLRTRFDERDGVPYQVIDPPRAFDLQRLDLSATSPQEREQQLCEYCEREQLRRFDLSAGPLMRATLVQMDFREYALLLLIHHIVSDGWSLQVLRRELAELYGVYSQSGCSHLAELPVQYADYAIWQRERLQGDLLKNELGYWRERLVGAPPQLELPTDRPRPATESFRGARVDVELPAKLCPSLTQFARHEGATLFMVLLTAYQILLSRWSGQRDVVVGVPIAGRTSPELEGLIGLFVNTLALRTDVSADLTFRQLLKRVKEEVAVEAYAHQEVPFEALVKELRLERDLGRHPLFQVMLAMQNDPEERLELPDTTWTWSDVERATSHFDLTLFLYRVSDRLFGQLEYATDLFDRGTIERMATQFRVLLEGIAESPDCAVGQLPLLGEMERRQVLVDWNATASPYPRERLIHELFEEQVRLTPHARAVEYEGQSLSYGELNRRANQLARYLVNEGVGPDGLVGICVGRSLEMVIGLLAVLKAGCAYVPLDPEYPMERLRYMLEDAAPQVVLTHEDLKPLLPSMRAEVVILDAKLKAIGGYVDENLSSAELGLTAQNRVYVIYTSGSTGRPKGTAMSHGAMVNLIEWHRQALPLKEGSRVLQFAALSFDVAFQEIFSTTCAGGTLVLLGEWIRRDARALAQFLRSHAIERLFVPPLMLQSLAVVLDTTGEVPQRLQDVITAGEQLRISPEISSLFQRLDGCRLHNHYGPTEAHVVTALTLSGDPAQWPTLPSIGRPISNIRMYVVDEGRRPAPIGVVGELYIAGAGVARGYLNRPDLTVERFLPDPFSADPQARMYRTGDLGRWRPDGTLEYLGRNDHQVKIRGFRIELEEIESQLVRHPDVKEATVVAREDTEGEKRLVAYVALCAPGDAERVPSVAALRAHLKGALPEHMVPSAFVTLERLPVTPNGKLDRRALPAPEPEAYASNQYEAPQGELEEILAGIWQDLLRVKRVGRHDNFFELGGHSLLITQVSARVESLLSIDMPIRLLFECPTIEQLSTQIEARRGERFRERIAVDENSTQRLLDTVASMPEGKARDLLRELKMERRL